MSQACAETPAIAAGRIRRAWPCVADAETILAKEFARLAIVSAVPRLSSPRLPDLLARGLLVSRRKAVTWRRAIDNVTFPALGVRLEQERQSVVDSEIGHRGHRGRPSWTPRSAIVDTKIGHRGHLRYAAELLLDGGRPPLPPEWVAAGSPLGDIG